MACESPLTKATYTRVNVRLYLWGGLEVNYALQFHLTAKLFHQEGMPVLVDSPLSRVDAAQLKHVQGKYIPEEMKCVWGGNGDGQHGHSCTNYQAAASIALSPSSYLSLYTERSKTCTGTPSALNRCAGGGCSWVRMRLMQELV